MYKYGLIMALSLVSFEANAQTLGNEAPAEIRTTLTTTDTATQAERVLAEAKYLVELDGPGYADYVVKNPLKEAIKTFEESQKTEADVATLEAAIKTFKSSSMSSSYTPLTEGQVFGIYQQTLDGTTKYLCIEGDQVSWVTEESKMSKLYSGETTDEQSGDDYGFFVTLDGKFLQLKPTGGPDGEAELTVSDVYDENCQIGFSARWRFVGELPDGKYPCEPEKLLGYLPATWKKPSTFGFGNWICLNKDNKIHVRDKAVLDETESAAFWIKNFGQHNNVAHLLQDNLYYGTFSSSVATSISQYVKLYYVSGFSDNWVTVEALPQDEANPMPYQLPAYTGVIVEIENSSFEAEETTGYSVVPSLEQKLPPLKGNMLKSTADKAVTLPAFANAYILGKSKVTGKLTFSKLSDTDRTIPPYHAYLILPDNEGSEMLKVIWGTPTAIDKVNPEQTTEQAPIYDLSGRQVNNVQKNGVYIQNGKKFIVK